MLLGRILQTFGCERLQSADNAETRVARLDHIVDIAVAGGVVGIGELVAVLLLLLGHELGLLLGALESGEVIKLLKVLVMFVMNQTVKEFELSLN